MKPGRSPGSKPAPDLSSQRRSPLRSPKPWRRYWTSLRTLFAGRPRKAPGQGRYRPRLETLEDRSTPSAVTWTGDGDHISWEDPLNWNTGTVPSANDDVGIRSAPMVNIDSAAAAHSLNSASSLDVIGSLALYAPSTVTQGVLQVDGTLDLEGGADLDVYSNANVYGRVQIASGTQLTLHSGTFMFGAATVVGDGLLRITDNATANIETTPTVENLSLEPTGQITGMGTLTINGTLDWTGGSMSGWGGVTQIAGGATAVLHGDAKVLDTWTFNDAGTATWSGGDITGMMGGTLDVQAGGDFAAQGNLSCWVNSMGGTVNVEGTLRTLGAATLLTVAATVNNTGTVDAAEDGQIAFNGPVNNGGNAPQNNTGTLGGPGTIVVNNNLNNTGTVGGTGTVILNANTTNAPGGTVGAANTVIVNGVLNTTGLIDGTGSVLINGTMNWTGGFMQGSGTTTVQGGGILNISYTDAIEQDARLLDNQGTLNWNGGTAIWEMTGTILNEGTFNMSPGMGNYATMHGPGTFVNSGGVIQVTTAPGATLSTLTFENRGSVQINTGDLHLGDVTGVSTGTFQVQAGRSMFLEASPIGGQTDITLDANQADSDSYMLRGEGWYVIRQAGKLTVAESNIILADNVSLEAGDDPGEAGGTLDGLGTLVVHNFRWNGGTMTSPDPGAGAAGITEIPMGGTLAINGVDDHTLDRRQLLNYGTAVWGAAGDLRGNIAVQNGGTIVTDGGRFDVWNDLAITNLGGQAGPFVVQNNGVFQKHLSEYLGTTTIQLAFQNNGGTVQADGSVNFAGGFTQSGQTAVTNLGIGTYKSGSVSLLDIEISSGTITLNGGTVIGRNFYLRAGVTFQASGEVTAVLLNVAGSISLQGNLDVSGAFWQIGGRTQINRFTLSSSAPSLRNEAAGIIELNGGTLTHTGGIAIINEGQILGPGIVNTRLIVNRTGATFRAGGGTQAGTTVVNGDFELDASASLVVEVGGTIPDTGYSQLNISGNAILGGTLTVLRLNGFDPSAGATFQILTFASRNGGFANAGDTIDLGGGLFLDINYETVDVTLVTRQQ